MKSLKLKSLVLAAGFAVATLSTVAGATGSVTTITPHTFSFSGSVTGGTGPAAVFDEYLGSFNLSSFEATVSFNAVVPGKMHLDNVELVDAITHVAIADSAANLSWNGGNSKYAFGYAAGVAPLSNYSIHFTGWSTKGATYSGLMTSAVPEPETYGMMLAGLGLMGFVARRRKSV